MNNPNKHIKPSENQDLSNIAIDNDNSDDFLIDICRLMRNNDEYHDLSEKPNFGREEVSVDRKEVKEADNVYTLKHFVHSNINKIRVDKNLQKEIKQKLERIKKTIVDKDSTEFAQLMMLELNIDDMLGKDIEED